MGRCIADYELIESGDRVMVAISGGKDSYTLLHLLERARQRAPVPFEIIAVHLDQGQPGYDGAALEAWLCGQGYEHQIVRKDTYQVVTKVIPEGQTYCSMCSRLRRGILYNVAQSLGCTKIALGHHRDDAIETLMLNMMFNGSLSAMPACNLCGSQDNLWRQQVKEMLDDIEKRAPQVRQSMLAALKNVHTSHLLGTS
jgi:tRNA 2-thiocytidine biosynthesis protein TtcA